MAYVSTSPSLLSVAGSPGAQAASSAIASTAVGVVNLYSMRTLPRSGDVGRIANARRALEATNIVHNIALAPTPLAPLVPLFDFTAKTLAGRIFEPAALKSVERATRRVLRDFAYRTTSASEEGHPSLIAHRLAAAGALRSDWLPPDVAAELGGATIGAHFLANPRTRAGDTETGLLIDFGIGPAADRAREGRRLQQQRFWAGLTAPGAGLSTGPFAQRTRLN